MYYLMRHFIAKYSILFLIYKMIKKKSKLNAINGMNKQHGHQLNGYGKKSEIISKDK